MTSRKPPDAQIAEMLQAALQNVTGRDAVGIQVTCTREELAGILGAYGEEALADHVPTLPEADLRHIYQRAGALSAGDSSLDRVLALAAVEVMEGEPRPLSRKRKKTGA